eukprot:UN11761
MNMNKDINSNKDNNYNNIDKRIKKAPPPPPPKITPLPPPRSPKKSKSPTTSPKSRLKTPKSPKSPKLSTYNPANKPQPIEAPPKLDYNVHNQCDEEKNDENGNKVQSPLVEISSMHLAESHTNTLLHQQLNNIFKDIGHNNRFKQTYNKNNKHMIDEENNEVIVDSRRYQMQSVPRHTFTQDPSNEFSQIQQQSAHSPMTVEISTMHIPESHNVVMQHPLHHGTYKQHKKNNHSNTNLEKLVTP